MTIEHHRKCQHLDQYLWGPSNTTKNFVYLDYITSLHNYIKFSLNFFKATQQSYKIDWVFIFGSQIFFILGALMVIRGLDLLSLDHFSWHDNEALNGWAYYKNAAKDQMIRFISIMENILNDLLGL